MVVLQRVIGTVTSVLAHIMTLFGSGWAQLSCPIAQGWLVDRIGVYSPSQLLGKIVLHPL